METSDALRDEIIGMYGKWFQSAWLDLASSSKESPSASGAKDRPALALGLTSLAFAQVLQR